MSSNTHALTIFMAHRGALVNYASKIVGDRDYAEDVVQEAYLRFDAAADQRMLGEPVAYLYRIVRNLALDVRRRVMRDHDRLAMDADAKVHHIAEDRPTPEATVEAKDDLRALAKAMAELPERMRIALELHRFGNCTFKEIAAHLNISVGLAHMLVVQGIEHCRQRLYRN